MCYKGKHHKTGKHHKPERKKVVLTDETVQGPEKSKSRDKHNAALAKITKHIHNRKKL